ncbi:MAG: sugar phosphate nucleotidyltransferase [Nitratireductor sp.]
MADRCFKKQRCDALAPFFNQDPLLLALTTTGSLTEDLLEIGIQADILLEPVSRNSCAAIALACLLASERSSDAKVLILASDHAIPDNEAFRRSVVDAASLADEGMLVTLELNLTLGYRLRLHKAVIQGRGRFQD